MKKSNLLFVLSAFVLAGCATNGSQSTEPSVPSTSTSTSTEPVIEKHAVVVPTAVAGAYVTASRSEAAQGDQIDVTVALTDPTNYELKSVKVGEQVLTGKVDANNKHVFHYSFEMGNANANIVVETEQIVAPTKDHTISFEGKDLAFAIEMPQDANVGDQVSFKVAAQSGYEITEVKVVKVAAASAAEGEDASEEPDEPVEETVALTGNAVIGYSFEMPDADVVIKAEALGAYFKLDASDTKVAFTSKGNAQKIYVQDFIKNYKNSDGESVYFSSPYFRAGSEVTVIANRSAYTTNVKYFANGVEMEAVNDATYLMYKFTMPATNTEISIEAEDKYIDIEVTDAEHVTSFVYRKETVDGVETKNPVTQGLPGETLYIDIASKDATKYKPDAPTSSMLGYTSEELMATSNYTSMIFTSVNATDENATYYFIVPTTKVSAGNLKINTAEKELLYAGKPFVGTWTGYEIYRNTFQTTLTTASINSDGSISGNAYGITSASIDSVDEAKGIISVKNVTKKLYYEGSSMWLYWSSGITDIYLLSKDIVDSKNIVKDICYDSKSNFIVAQLFETVGSETPLRASALIDLNGSGAVTLNIEVEMISGSKISESGAKFLVKKNNETLKAFGLGDEYGTYTQGDSTLVLDGAGKATLDGVAGTYVVDSANKNKITVVINEVEYSYAIDKASHSFADFVEGAKSLYTSFKSTAYNNTLILNEDRTGKYNGTAITYAYNTDTKKVTFSCNGLDFNLTWDEIAGTLVGTFDDGDGPYDITFNIPFYIGTFNFTLLNTQAVANSATLTLTADTIVVKFGTTTFTVTSAIFKASDPTIFCGEDSKYIEVTMDHSTGKITRVEIYSDGDAEKLQYQSEGDFVKQA